MKFSIILIICYTKICLVSAQNISPSVSFFQNPLSSSDTTILVRARKILSKSIDRSDIYKSKLSIDRCLLSNWKETIVDTAYLANDLYSTILLPYLCRCLYMLSLGNYIEETVPFTTYSLIMEEEKRFFKHNITKRDMTVTGIKSYHMRNDSCDIYFIINKTGKNVVVNGQFYPNTANSMPVCWQPSTGSICYFSKYPKDNDRILVTLLLHKDETLFLVFEKDNAVINGISLGGLINYVSHIPIYDEKIRLYNRKKYLSSRGTMIYELEFNINKDLTEEGSYFIEFPYKNDYRQICINDKNIGGAWFRSVYISPIDSFLQEGNNKISIEVLKGKNVKNIKLWHSDGYGVLI